MYQFNNPYNLDGSRFLSEFKDFEYTGFEEGIEKSLAWYKKYFSIG